jgi:hypothetical protein
VLKFFFFCHKMPNFLTGLPSSQFNQIISTNTNRFSSVASQQIGNSLQQIARDDFSATAISMGVTGLIPVIGNNFLGGVLQNALGSTILGPLPEPYEPPSIPVTPIYGTKPKSLYTGYAGSKAEGDQPYSESQDIVFFLLRADQTVPQASEPVEKLSNPSEIISELPSEIPVDGQTGGSNFLGTNIPTPLGQLALAATLDAVTGLTNRTLQNAGLGSFSPLVGYLTGLQIERYFGQFGEVEDEFVDQTSQSTIESSPLYYYDIFTERVTGPDVKANAQAYFQNLTNQSFNSGENPVFTSGTNNSLSGELAERFPQVNSDSQLESVVSEVATPIDKTGTSALSRSFSENAIEIQTNNAEELIPKSWYFITSPKDVSWKKAGKASTVNTFGSNTPYVVYGNTGLRTLTLGEVMLEGFSDRKTVEANILALETCMNMVMNRTVGYVAPYCWKLFAGGKNYGTFIITSVNVKEVMRDTRGFATRATVDIELQQVPEFQVNTGRDLASKAMSGALSPTVEQALIPREREQPENPRLPNSNRSGSGDSTPSSPPFTPPGSRDVRPTPLDQVNTQSGGATNVQSGGGIGEGLSGL